MRAGLSSAPPKEASGSPIPQEVLRKVRRVEIRARRLVKDLFLGDYHSAFKGRGIEFHEVREYQPGDDFRTIDWNVTARMGHPYVKKYVEERELTVVLMVDVSPSQGFGTHRQTKREIATEISALLALAAVTNNDKVGLIAFTDDIEQFIPPKKGEQHVLRLVRELLWLRPAGGSTDIAQALHFLERVQKRRAVVFLISDFLATGFDAALAATSRKHDIVGIVIIDPRETELPPMGLLRLEDAETGEERLLDTWDASLRGEFARLAAQEREGRRRLLQSLKVDQVEIMTHRPYVEPLLAFFNARARKEHQARF